MTASVKKCNVSVLSAKGCKARHATARVFAFEHACIVADRPAAGTWLAFAGGRVPSAVVPHTSPLSWLTVMPVSITVYGTVVLSAA